MPRHTETRHMPYSPEQMFDLVADVKRYQEFLPWVAATRVRSDTETLMVADLVVGFKSLKETFASRVTKERPRSVTVDLIQSGLWGDTRIVAESQKSSRRSADEALWRVSVPANGEAAVTATFDTRF